MSSAIAIRNNLQPAEVEHLANQIAPKFPRDCNPQQALEIARIALAYELDPFLGELIPYQGQPYVTIAGRLRIADRSPAYDGYDLEPATADERKALGATAEENVWKATVYRKDRSRPTVAYGRAGGQVEQNPVAKRWTPEVAQKRALHRAMRAAFPMPLPGLEESLSSQQLRAIHAVDNELGISQEERHGHLVETFGVESSAQLTSGQASVYLDERTVDAATGEILSEEPAAPLSLREQLEADITSLVRSADACLDMHQLRVVFKRARELSLADDARVADAIGRNRERLTPAVPDEQPATQQPALA